jgi:hypothetical protein
MTQKMCLRVLDPSLCGICAVSHSSLGLPPTPSHMTPVSSASRGSRAWHLIPFRQSSNTHSRRRQRGGRSPGPSEDPEQLSALSRTPRSNAMHDMILTFCFIPGLCPVSDHLIICFYMRGHVSETGLRPTPLTPPPLPGPGPAMVGRLATKPGRPNQHSGQLQLSRTRAPPQPCRKQRYTVCGTTQRKSSRPTPSSDS